MKKIVKCILPIVSSAALAAPIMVSCGESIINLKFFKTFDGASFLYSEKLNLTAGTTFSFSADFRKWQGTYEPWYIEFCHWDNEELTPIGINFSLDEMYLNGTLISPIRWENHEGYVALYENFALEIFQNKPTLTGVITLQEDSDLVEDMLCFDNGSW